GRAPRPAASARARLRAAASPGGSRRRFRPRRRPQARRRPLRPTVSPQHPEGGTRSGVRGARNTRACASSPACQPSRPARRNPFMPETAVHVASGKVREIFELDTERLLLVASDRISTFDVVLPTEIPDKGRVHTGLSGFWFARMREIVPNHLLALRPDGRSTEAKRLRMLPMGWVGG